MPPKQYPKYLFSATDPPMTVLSSEEHHARLAAGWSETPVAAETPAAAIRRLTVRVGELEAENAKLLETIASIRADVQPAALGPKPRRAKAST